MTAADFTRMQEKAGVAKMIIQLLEGRPHHTLVPGENAQVVNIYYRRVPCAVLLQKSFDLKTTGSPLWLIRDEAFKQWVK